jgi:hypothetical protein
MDSSVSLGDVANIITFVAPGYFALVVYAHIFTKGPKDFSRLLIESVIFSLPIVTLTHFVWEFILRQQTVQTISVGYAALLIALSVIIGLVAAYTRTHWPVKSLATHFGFGSPDEDFIRAQFARLRYKNGSVAITLKSGGTFSGTPKRGTIYAQGETQKYYFDNIAWYNLKSGKWEEGTGGLILNLDEVEYIATPPLRED